MNTYNPLSALHAKVAKWPMWAQVIYYGLETSTIASIVIFLNAIQVASSMKGGLAHFDWEGQIYDILLAVKIGLVKGLIDLAKMVSPPKPPQGS